MFLPLEWHPFEIRRRLELFLQNLALDLDFRYPEVRHRQSLELQALLEDAPSKNSFQFMDELSETVKKISLFDWKILFEWNERCQTVKVLVALHLLLKKEILESANERVIEKIRERLRTIAKLMDNRALSNNPSTLELIRYRWKMASLRDEAEYLISRWPS